MYIIKSSKPIGKLNFVIEGGIIMNNEKNNLSSESLNLILNILNEIKYGTLTLVVQDGKVIQIERNEKIRL